MIRVEMNGQDCFTYDHLITQEVLTFLNSLRVGRFKKDEGTGKYYHELGAERPAITMFLGTERYEIRDTYGLGQAEIPAVAPNGL